jgi:hypothetical protein
LKVCCSLREQIFGDLSPKAQAGLSLTLARQSAHTNYLIRIFKELSGIDRKSGALYSSAQGRQAAAAKNFDLFFADKFHRKTTSSSSGN